MLSSDKAHLRYISYYLGVLSGAAVMHVTNACAGLRAFDLAWANIRRGNQLANERALSKRDFAELVISFGTCQFDLLHLRRHPRQQISWLENPLQLASEFGREKLHAGIAIDTRLTPSN